MSDYGRFIFAFAFWSLAGLLAADLAFALFS